ncbi:copper resistance protein B [Lysobacter capsici]|nr:copper resistance protein B [Lysobacter capsici]
MNTMPSLPYRALALSLGLALAGAAQAQGHEHSKMDHAAHQAAQKPPAKPAAAVDHSTMDHSKMDHAGMGDTKPAAPEAKPAPMDHSQMDHSQMDHSRMTQPRPAASEPREPIPQPTDADRAAAFAPISLHMQHAPEFNHYVLINRLEAVDAEHGNAQAWEGQAWFGNDTDRLWLRSEGEREDGRVESANLEALYGRAISPWWDVVIGAKRDLRPEHGQTWAAFGVQGMAPYKFEIAATAYIGEAGRTALNFEAEYELLLTNRLILQPLIEVDLYGRDDPQRGIGAGLSTVEAGLRLRYEITRQFAPYLGVTWERAFGDTADYRRAAGEDNNDAQLVAGVRMWF